MIEFSFDNPILKPYLQSLVKERQVVPGLGKPLFSLTPRDISAHELCTWLFNIKRYAGRGPNVHDHSIAMYTIARKFKLSLETQLSCLIHDLHEAFLGDAPSPCGKSEDVRALEAHLDSVIAERLGTKVFDLYNQWGHKLKNQECHVIDVIISPIEMRSFNIWKPSEPIYTPNALAGLNFLELVSDTVSNPEWRGMYTEIRRLIEKL